MSFRPKALGSELCETSRGPWTYDHSRHDHPDIYQAPHVLQSAFHAKPTSSKERSVDHSAQCHGPTSPSLEEYYLASRDRYKPSFARLRPGFARSYRITRVSVHLYSLRTDKDQTASLFPASYSQSLSLSPLNPNPFPNHEVNTWPNVLCAGVQEDDLWSRFARHYQRRYRISSFSVSSPHYSDRKN